MAQLKLKPPRVSIPKKGDFWKQIVMIVIGTTISLVLTVATAEVMSRHQRAKDRKLSAMMVTSNIEVFSRLLDEYADYLSTSDSIATWLLSKPLEELEQLPADELNGLIDQATLLPFLSYDKSAENIFSNNIETWKNMGNVVFINLVGQCFSSMRQIENHWNERSSDLSKTILDIKDHPDDYEGSTIPMKIIRCEKIRRSLRGIHYWRAWLSHGAATLRYQNRKNMESIGITEQEVMDYTHELEVGSENTNPAPEFSDYYHGPISPDSLTSLRDLDVHLAQLNGAQ